MARSERRYRAFISYSQADTGPAQRLHKALETYRVPLGISPDVVPADLHGRSRRRLGRFFRDTDEMAAATDVSATVRGAIEDSDSLIVICSPRSAQSRWVSSEVEHFRSTGRGDHVYAVIVDGAPNSGNPETECFPPGLRADYKSAAMPIEPLGIDLRKDSLDRACTRIAAGLLGVRFDDLWQRNRREARRRLMLVGGVAAAIVVVAAGAMLTIWGGQERAAGALRSAQLAQAAQAASDLGDYDRAARYAVAGLKGADSPLTGFDASGAEAELRRALQGNVLYTLREDTPVARPDDPEPTFLSLAFSPDGERFIVGADDGKAMLRETATGKLVAVLDGHKEGVRASFSPDGARILTLGAGQDGLAILWDAKTATKIAALPLDAGPYQQASFSADSTRLITSSNNQRARVWDAATGRMLSEFTSPEAIVDTALSPDGKEAVAHTAINRMLRWDATTGGYKGEVLLRNWEAPTLSPDRRYMLSTAQSSAEVALKDTTGKRILSFSNVDHAASSVAFSPDGQRVAVGSYAGTIDVYDTKSAKVLAAWSAYGSEVTSVTFSADGRRILSTSALEPAAVWSVDSAFLGDLGLLNDSAPDAQAISADGSRAATASRDGVVTVWAIDPPERATILQGEPQEASLGEASLSPDGRMLAVQDADANVAVWNLASGQRETLLLADQGVTGAVFRTAFSPDGAGLLSLRNDGRWTVWTIGGGAGVTHAAEGAVAALGVAWTAAGPRVLMLDNDTAGVWDAATGKRLSTLASPKGVAGGVTLSPDGKLVAAISVATDGLEDVTAMERAAFVTISEVETGKLVTVLTGNEAPVFDVAFSPDSRTILTSTVDDVVRVWDVATGAQKRVLKNLRSIAPAFSPDGKSVALTDGDAISVLTLADGTVAQFGKRGDQVRTLAFSPDGRMLADTREGGVSRLWDLASRRQVAQFNDGGDAVWYAGFTRDGQLVTAGVSGAIRVRALPEVLAMKRDALAARACTAMLLGATSRFTAEEMKAVPLLDPKRDADACGR